MIFSKAPRQETEVRSDNEQEPIEAAQSVEAREESPPELEVVKSESDDWQTKCGLLQDQYARLAADFDNYRKRVREEQESMVKYGAQKTILEMLPVLDNLERAAGSLSENSDPQVLFKSFGIVKKQLLDKMEALGVKKIPAIGQQFDPQFHEAVNRMESAEFPENTNMFEAQSGYTLHDKVIRPAMVVVSTGAPESTSTEEVADASAPESAGEETTTTNPFRQ